LRPIFQWQTLHFQGDGNEDDTSHVINSLASALGSVRVYGDRVFASVPRWRDGVPFTLVAVPWRGPRRRGEAGSFKYYSPALRPFPSAEDNKVGECSGGALQSVGALEMSPDGLLFAADSGQAAIFARPNRDCGAKLVVFDVSGEEGRGDQLVGAYKFPRGVVLPKSLLRHMVLDYFCRQPEEVRGGDDSLLKGRRGPCFAYISDVSHGALVVLDVLKQKSWRVEAAASMAPSHEAVRFHLGRQWKSLNLRSGVAGLALETNAEQVKKKRDSLISSGRRL